MRSTNFHLNNVHTKKIAVMSKINLITRDVFQWAQFRELHVKKRYADVVDVDPENYDVDCMNGR